MVICFLQQLRGTQIKSQYLSGNTVFSFSLPRPPSQEKVRKDESRDEGRDGIKFRKDEGPDDRRDEG